MTAGLRELYNRAAVLDLPGVGAMVRGFAQRAKERKATLRSSEISMGRKIDEDEHDRAILSRPDLP
jgi:hypothetical protein